MKTVATQGSLARLKVYDNGVPVFGKSGVALSGKAGTTDLKVPLTVGSNFIELSATDTNGNESIRRDLRVVRIDLSGKKARLFVVAAGLSNYRDRNMALKYAAKDAGDVASAFSTLTSFAKVEPLVLPDAQVSGNFMNRIRIYLSQAAVDDEVVLFLSGHGFRDADQRFHFVPYDFNLADRSRWGITDEDIEDLLDQVASGSPVPSRRCERQKGR